MVLIIDKSGSMGGQKIELAKDAARGAVELLGPRDQIGVIAFDGSPYWVSDVRPASQKGMVSDRIAGIEAGGGTTLYPAMEEAYGALQATSAKLKHVIILTDGHSTPGDFEGITQAMASSRITVSTVGVGDADQALLERIAETGNGRYYFTDDPSSVPQIFAKETMAASKSAINEEPFIPQVIRSTPVLSDINFDEAPFEVSEAGAYHLQMSQMHNSQMLYQQSRGLVVGYPDELRLKPTNESLLKTIARTTGGQYDPDPTSVFRNEEERASRATPLWPYLVMAALMLFLADVALRRIDFSIVFGYARHRSLDRGLSGGPS